jgi:hypothetical protein
MQPDKINERRNSGEEHAVATPSQGFPAGSAGAAPLKTIYGIRLQNYKRLLLAFRDRPDQQRLPKHGLLTRFAAEAGLRSARYLSHVNNGRKNIGDELARQLERGMGRPEGWLDNEHADPGPYVPAGSEEHFLEMARAVFQRSPVQAQAALLQVMANYWSDRP